MGPWTGRENPSRPTGPGSMDQAGVDVIVVDGAEEGPWVVKFGF